NCYLYNILVGDGHLKSMATQGFSIVDIICRPSRLAPIASYFSTFFATAFEADTDVRIGTQGRHPEILQLRQLKHRSHLDNVVNVVCEAKRLSFLACSCRLSYVHVSFPLFSCCCRFLVFMIPNPFVRQ